MLRLLSLVESNTIVVQYLVISPEVVVIRYLSEFISPVAGLEIKKKAKL